MDVIVHATPYRADVVVRDLAGIEGLVFRHQLELLRDNEVTGLRIISVRAELRESRHNSRLVTLTEIFPDQIEAPPVEPTVEPVAFPFRGDRGRKSAPRTVAIHAQRPRGRKDGATLVPAC